MFYFKWSSKELFRDGSFAEESEALAVYEEFGKKFLQISPAFSSGQCDSDGKREEEAR